MKYTWEKDDIIAGLYVIKGTADVKNNISYSITVTFKIGFDLHHSSESQYGLCNCLTDGWYNNHGTKEDLVNYLNTDNYRPLSKSEYLKMIEFTNQGFHNI